MSHMERNRGGGEKYRRLGGATSGERRCAIPSDSLDGDQGSAGLASAIHQANVGRTKRVENALMAMRGQPRGLV